MNNFSTMPDHHSNTFIKYVWNESSNRQYLLWAIGVSIFQFVVFKLAYPFADFISDSYKYIFAAYAHLNVGIWPIGYSEFLSLFHQVTWSDTALTAFQYFLMQLSALYFSFTMSYFLNTSKWT